MRFGKIALARRDLVTIKSDPSPDADLINVEACLVETHSWGGSSGAPAFLTLSQDRRQWAKSWRMTLSNTGSEPKCQRTSYLRLAQFPALEILLDDPVIIFVPFVAKPW